jgi:hypothetical protein
MIADLRNTFRVSFIMSDAPMPIASASELLADVRLRPFGTARRSLRWTPIILACIWTGTWATGSSSSATRTGNLKAHGVFLDLTLEDVQKDTDAALASSR